MLRSLLAIPVALVAAALAGAAEEPDLARRVEQLKAQVAELARNSGPRIGIVDIVRVFDELEEKIDMNAELHQTREKHEAKLRDLAKAVNDFEEKAKLVNPESEEGRKTLQQLEDAKRDLRTYRMATEDHLYGKLFDFTKSIFVKMQAEIDAYAAEAGYDLVLRAREKGLGDFDQSMAPRMRYMDLNRRIEARNILYARPAYDFTDVIIKRLNAKYQAEKKVRRDREPEEPPKPKSEK